MPATKILLRNATLIALLLVGISAQAKKIDSLKKELSRSTTNESRAQLLLSIGKYCVNRNNFDTALVYLRQSMLSSEKAGNDSLLMESVALTGFCLNHTNRFEEGQKYIDSAIGYARAAHVPDRLMNYLIEKVNTLVSLSKTADIPAYCKEALAIAQATHFKAGEARIYLLTASFYSLLNDYSGELEYINKSIPIFDSLKRYGDVSQCYTQILINFSRQKKYKEALKYAMISDSLFQKSGNNSERNNLKTNIAIIYKNMGEYDRAISLYYECLDSFKNNNYLLMYVYSNLGIAQSLKGSFADAKKSFVTALALNREFHIPDFDIENNKELGRAFLRVKQFDSALLYAKKSEQIYNEHNTDLNTHKEIISLVRDVYEARGDMANAHFYDKKYEALQDTLFSKTLANSLAAAEARFSLFEKDKTIAVLGNENELQKVKGERQAIALVLGALIVIIIVIAYRRALSRNKLLFLQKQELQRQQLELQEQKNIIDAQVVQLASAAKMKSKFLANISHELRTPVTLLNGMLEMMNGKKQPGEIKEKERLDIAYNNSRKLQQMVEEILDLTKLENNRSQPVYATTEIAPLLRRIVYAFETLIDKEHLVLEYDDARAHGSYLSIDSSKFEKVINNLVYNAVKFNRKGGHIKVSIYATSDKKGVQIDVSDSGIGIASVDVPHIFEHFYQGETSGLKADGAGIGLSLVKEFTTLMRGNVQVKSELGVGTTFSLLFDTVPQPAGSEEQQIDIEETATEAWERFTTRPKLLIVEDNAEMRYYLQEVLGEKTDIATAGNGIEGLKQLEQNIPDLIISDVMMPGMDGRAFINLLKNDERYKKIPIITLTALADKESELGFLKLGVDDYIVKPFNADELRIRVYNLLANLADRRAFAQEPTEPGEVPTEDKEAEEFRIKITDYVLANIKNTDLSVDDLTQALLISRRQLYRMSKTLTGYAPAQMIKEIRLQKAHELLLSGNIYKVEDVSNRVGYEHPGYFAQQFFERFGKRPTDFF